MNKEEKRRVVAIVGRPNVGKSAIFNRLAGRRIAIVHAQSGVTRDRLMREITWEGERFDLIDTGGVCNIDNSQTKDRIDSGIRSQVDAALEDAAVAMLVVDVDAGLMPMDLEVANLLRSSGCETIVAVNKADNPERDEYTAEFLKLGFPVFPVSALHDRGFWDLMEPIVEHLPETENKTVVKPLKVAVVGRPNVGKSSYINRLLKNERVIVTDIPGTTRDSIDIPFVVGKGEQARHYIMVDTAGMRRVGKIDSSVERFSRFRAERSIDTADVVVIVLDSTCGPTEQDKKIASYAKEKNKGCMLLVNKWDLEETTQKQYGPQIFKDMPFMGHCPVVFASAKSGYNIRRSIDAIDYVSAQVNKVIPTGVLNRAILAAFEKVHPPSVKGKFLKIYYATQTGTAPTRIRMFVNNPKLVKQQYRSYLERILREKFGLEGASIILQFRGKSR